MRRSLRIAFAGGEAAGQRVLRALCTEGHDVVVAFCDHGPVGDPVRAEATRLGIPLELSGRVRDPEVTREIGPVDVIVNVHSLKVVAPQLLEWPRFGAFNLHPGWLPDFAGRNCPSWAVWLGEPEPGVTVHRMVPEIDRGEIALQERFSAGTNPTGGAVAIECAKRGIALIGRLVDAIADDSLELHRQDPDAFVYYGREVPDGGRFSVERTAAELDRLVRACDYGPFRSPWGVPTASIGNIEVGVRQARPTGLTADSSPGTVRSADGTVLIACADEWLQLLKVTIDGVPMSADVGLSRLAGPARSVRPEGIDVRGHPPFAVGA